MNNTNDWLGGNPRICVFSVQFGASSVLNYLPINLPSVALVSMPVRKLLVFFFFFFTL